MSMFNIKTMHLKPNKDRREGYLINKVAKVCVYVWGGRVKKIDDRFRWGVDDNE